MNEQLRADADQIIDYAIRAVQPNESVLRALRDADLSGNIVLVAVGKAAWQMAATASDYLGERIRQGVVCTKYGHCMGGIDRVDCYEGGHPVPDENSFAGTQAALKLTQDLTVKDTVLFLVSGGGSALFEKPLVSFETLQSVTEQLLACGADIVEMNTIRKRLSAVKGGRFAQHCMPAKVFQIVLSDVLGDPLDTIASGPACPDSTMATDAQTIVEKYGLQFDDDTQALLAIETPKTLQNVTTCITGSVRELCKAAVDIVKSMGYEPILLTDRLCCEAREAGRFLAAIGRTHAALRSKVAFIAGGETVVHLMGSGLGGRNQELVLAAAAGIEGLEQVAVFSVGSDGTDGPTDAAGGYADGDTAQALRTRGIDAEMMLKNNDAYHALGPVEGLVITGPTGTNVNDITVVLVSA